MDWISGFLQVIENYWRNSIFLLGLALGFRAGREQRINTQICDNNSEGDLPRMNQLKIERPWPGI